MQYGSDTYMMHIIFLSIKLKIGTGIIHIFYLISLDEIEHLDIYIVTHTSHNIKKYHQTIRNKNHAQFFI